MLHQKPRAPGWRDVRAKAIREGRLNEEAVAAHKRRLIAANIDHALTERRQAAGLTRAELAARLGIPETHVARLEDGHPDEVRNATLRAYLRALRGERAPQDPR
ncbi:MAG TPA: helix-turn-helix domain-containing protein [Trueperaceae bacterium]|nr:helix-turn-helix domain-containing protein [Trueperaceae bacterium]